jgi:polyhydroxyalkanoate synthesis regulator phasin
MTKHIQTQLDKLVADGTITKEQADKVFTFWKKKNHPDLIKDLMKHTDLSEGQAKAVADALRPPAPPVPPCDQRPQ